MSVSQTLGVVRRSELTDNPPRAESLDDYKVCRQGDIVFNKMSIRDGAMGVAREGGLVTYHYEVMRPRPGADPRYVVYLMKSEWFAGELIQRERGIGVGGTAGVRTTEVPFSVLRTIDAPIPESVAQRAIADYLDAETARIDSLVEARRHQLRVLPERLAALVAELVAGIRREPLGHCLESVEQGWSPTADDAVRDSDDQWAVLKLSAVTGGTFRPNEHKILPASPGTYSRYEVRAGDLLMTRANTPELVGDVVFVDSAPSRLLIPDLVYRLGYNRHRASGRYLGYVLRTDEVRGQLAATARGSSQTMVKIRGADIRQITIPLPDVHTQTRITQAMDRANAGTRELADSLVRQVALLAERRQALITAAVTGQIDIPGVAA
jgi:type I restriction enzyme S subunit